MKDTLIFSPAKETKLFRWLAGAVLLGTPKDIFTFFYSWPGAVIPPSWIDKL
jgi:hypothetical protein